MAPPRARVRERLGDVLELPNEPACVVQAEAIDRQTVVIERLVEEIAKTREAFTPAADALHDLNQAQKRLCNFIVGHRLKIVLFSIVVLVAVGGISPNVASALGGFLKMLGWA